MSVVVGYVPDEVGLVAVQQAAREAMWRETDLVVVNVVDSAGFARPTAADDKTLDALGERLTVDANPAARDLMRHAFSDVGGNGNRARSWARFVRRWPVEPRRELLDAYPQMRLPVLLLWAEDDPAHPLAPAREMLDLLPDGQLRTLPGTGFLIAYDDPVALARELIAFSG